MSDRETVEDYILMHTDQIGGHPVKGFVDKALRHIESEGTSRYSRYGGLDCDWDHSCYFMITQTGEIVAALTYSVMEWNRTIHTGWSYTSPEHRRLGLNTRLAEAVEDKAKVSGITRIYRQTNVWNKQMLDAMKQQGYTAESVRLFKDVQPDNSFSGLREKPKK